MGTALVTGSGRKRVGYVIAKHLAGEGHDIAIHYHRSEKSAHENVAELNTLGVKAMAFQADVSAESDVCQLIEKVVQEFGSLDLLVTTSSIWNEISLEDVTAEDVLASFKVNTLGTFLCCQHAGRVMTAQETGGSIVTIGDALMNHPYVNHAAYFTAKGAIPTLTKAFAVELAARNSSIKVNCVLPGPVMFPDDLSAEARQAQTDSTLLQTADEPASLAEAVLFLARNRMLTGCCIELDGGRNVGLENLRRHGDASGSEK